MNSSEMHAAVNEAKATISRADLEVGRMASMIAGRLRNGRVHCGALEELKRELKDYNIHTRSWKDQK